MKTKRPLDAKSYRRAFEALDDRTQSADYRLVTKPIRKGAVFEDEAASLSHEVIVNVKRYASDYPARVLMIGDPGQRPPNSYLMGAGLAFSLRNVFGPATSQEDDKDGLARDAAAIIRDMWSAFARRLAAAKPRH